MATFNLRLLPWVSDGREFARMIVNDLAGGGYHWSRGRNSIDDKTSSNSGEKV